MQLALDELLPVEILAGKRQVGWMGQYLDDVFFKSHSIEDM